MTYDERHLELLQTAAALFADRGFHNASIRDLAKVTGRSLSGLYYYFPTKDELLFQIQHHCYSTLLETVQGAMVEAKTPRDKLVSFIGHHLGYFRHNMNEMKVLAHEDLTLKDELGEKILDLKRRYSKVLIDIIAEFNAGAPEGLKRPDPEIAAFALFGMMNWLYTWPKRLRSLPATDLAQSVAQLFLCGYPGCAVGALADLRESLTCVPQEFWKQRSA
jgi:AcrR family transcriptional regulator